MSVHTFSVTRRKFLHSALGTAGLSLAYPCYMEPRWLEVTRHRIKLPRARFGSPIRVLHMSDLHASPFVSLTMIDHAVTAGLEEKPDLICLTGDFITYRGGFDAADYSRTLRRLSAAAPSFAVLGNHDGGMWASSRAGYRYHTIVERVLEESGIELLHNRSKQVDVRGQRLTFAGVGDLWTEEVDGARAFAGVDASQPVVLLAHNPDSKDVLRRRPWDLMLSGHTHGGQVIVPFKGNRYAPVRDKRYVEGLKPWHERQIYVTRGVGNVGGVRLACRPEVSLLLLSDA